MLSALPDEYLSARADDVGDHLIGLLHNQGVSDSAALFTPDSVVVADELTPTQTAQLTADVVALVTRRESKTGHAAIIARTVGIPMVVGAGDAGTVTVNPEEAELAAVREQRRARETARQKVLAAVYGHAVTQDGTSIEVLANIGGPKDVEVALANGAEGGRSVLYRVPVPRKRPLADGGRTVCGVRDVLTAFDGALVIIRTLDIGGDKPLTYTQLRSSGSGRFGSVSRILTFSVRSFARFCAPVHSATCTLWCR